VTPARLVENQLGEAFAAVDAKCAPAGSPGKFSNTVLQALRLGFSFADTHPGNLRVGVGHRRYDAGIKGGLATGTNLGGNLALVGSLVRQHRLPCHITDGEDVRNVGTHLVVDRDKSLFIYLDTGGRGIYARTVG
jgi:hypothetical protein